MRSSAPVLHAKNRRRGVVSVVTLTGLFLAGPLAGSALAAATVVPLGTASAFSVLAGSTVTNTGTTTVDRSVGVSPGTAITGSNTMVVGGTYHSADAVAAQAKLDLTNAYTNAAGQRPRIAQDPELGGETLVGGVYNRAKAMALTGALTLDAQNDPDSVWVFQAGSTLTTGSGSSVLLINGADPCNVFWQVGSSATLGTTTRFVGTIMADQTITMNTGATLRGRVLARSAAVNLHNNVITSPGCDTDVDVADGTTSPPDTGGTGGTGTGGGTGGNGGTGGGTGNGGGGTGGGTGGTGTGTGTGTGNQVSTTPIGSVDTGYAGPIRTSGHDHAALVRASSMGVLLAGLAMVAVLRRRRV